MDKFDRHVGNGQAITIDEDTFVIKPLGVSHMKDFFKLMRKFDGAKKEEDFLRNLDDETSDTISRIIMATLKKSYPEIAQEKLEEFGMKNFGVILPAIFEVNMGTEENPAVKKVKQMTENVQNTA